MRKQYKLKKHSCGLCKPHKMHGAGRWKLKDEDRLRRDEKSCHDAVGKVET